MNRVISLIKNEYAFSLITKCFDMVVAMFQSILIARFLGPALTGTYTYIFSVISITSIIITFGFHQAYPYLRKEYGENVITYYLGAIYLIYSIYFIFALCLVVIFNFGYEFIAVAIFTPIFGYTNVVAYVSLIENPNKRNIIWSITGLIEDLFLVLLLFCAQRSIKWMIIILAFVRVIRGVFFTVFLNCKAIVNKETIKLLIEMYKIGFFPMLALLMTTLNYRIDVLMLKQYETISMASIGIYSIGISVADKMVLVPDTLKGVLASKLTKGAREEEVAKISRICLWVSIMICAVFLILGKWGIIFLYGKEFTSAYTAMVISAFGSVAISYFKLIGQYNIINRKQVKNVIMLTIAIIIDVVFNLIMIPKWGINGAAFSTGLGNFVCGVVFVIYFSRTTGISIKDMVFIKRTDVDDIKNILIGNSK